MRQLRQLFICLSVVLLSQGVWAYTFGQSSFSLKRFLDANPSQLPLIEQLSVRVHSQPVPLLATHSDTQKIAVVLHESPQTSSNRAWFMAFKRRMQELSIDFRLDVFQVSPQEGVRSAISAFKKIESANFDYVIVDRINDHNRPLLERILKQQEVEVLMLNTIAPFSSWHLHPPLLYIGIDTAKMMKTLASYVNRRLEDNVVIDVLSVQDPYKNETSCQIFLNELYQTGRKVRRRYQLKDNASSGYDVAEQIIKENQLLRRPHFIFSCTPNIGEGVAQALSTQKEILVTTNAWLGQRGLDAANQKGIIMVTVLENKDYMAIAAAEAIKADIESRLLPAVYMESFSFLIQEMDDQTRNITFQQALPYSISLWPR